MPKNSTLDQPHGLVEIEIVVAGQSVTNDISNIAIYKSLNKISTAKFEIYNGSGHAANFPLFDTETYAVGNDVEIKMGYQTQKDTVFKGKIVKHGAKIAPSKHHKIQVECTDVCIKLTGQREFKIFEEMKDSDIIKQIAGDKGISVSCSDTDTTHQRVVQHNCSGWDFIITRAQANYLVAITDNGELKVKKPSEGAEKGLKVVHGENINTMDISIDARTQMVEVETSSWDYKAQQNVKGSSGEPTEVDTLGNGSINGKNIAQDLGYEKTKLHSTGHMDTTELNKWAKSTLLLSRLTRVRGTIKTQGFENVNPNDFLTIESVSAQFDGEAYVSGVYHEQNDGNWLTTIELGVKPELFIASKTDVTLPISDGLFPGYAGLFIGKVLKIDGDPDGESRVLVQIPLLGQEVTEGVWARVSNIMASQEYGSFFMPEIDDEVVLGALGGDLRFPIILGHLYSSGRNYDTGNFEHNADNNDKGWITRSGMLFHFNDQNKVIRLETPAGNILNLDEDNGQILIEDQHGNKIVMDSSGIEITSIGDFTVNASGKIEQSSGGNSKYKATGSYEASANSEATLKTTSGGKVVVQGPLVKLN